jgi:hypothetical protein
LAVLDLGPTRLKNIADPVRVYSLEAGPAKANQTSGTARKKPADDHRSGSVGCRARRGRGGRLAFPIDRAD